MRAFTLLEITIAATIFAVMTAVSVPVALDAIAKRRRESAAFHVEVAVNAARDAARRELRCVTVLGTVPPDGDGSLGISAWQHKTADCTDTTIDAAAPDVAGTLVELAKMHPSVAGSVEILHPDVGCPGVPPSEGCYCPTPTGRFLIRADGTADEPYRIRVTRSDGVVDRFLIHPATGTIRRDR